MGNHFAKAQCMSKPASGAFRLSRVYLCCFRMQMENPVGKFRFIPSFRYVLSSKMKKGENLLIKNIGRNKKSMHDKRCMIKNVLWSMVKRI